ncbi:MAG: c-type cytochrome [Gemmataceae bacterium]|nr:c-type cytochrome [Gemmataceae bacterium]
MRRAIAILALAFIGIGVFTYAQQPPPALPQKGSGPGKALSPQDAQKLFKLDDGLRIELVACEPQIESPVAMQFDPDGRLWVVEMRDYPNGPGKGEKPAGRIRILEDKDGDGFFETSTIWADNLLFANGLLLWKDGAIVTMAPKITHLRDTKGGGKADTENVLYTGFAEQNPQLRVSHPNLGLDGWIYCANGLRGGKVIHPPSPQATKEPAGSPVDLSGMDFRFDPVNPHKYEAITGPGQFGNTFDEWGNRFVCDNRHHLRHVVMENRYIKRNPYLAAPSLLEDVSVLDDGPLSSGGKVYPLSKNWTTSSLHEGRFTAACGVFIYHGEALGKLYRGAAFTCEPTGNLVHMEILTPKGATFSAKPHKQGVEFLATTDDWFRPVFLTHGPEGALYIADMYRAVIEHPDFMPPELKNRPDLSLGKDKGRIWRIVPKDHKTKTPRPGLAKASIAELVKTLEHEEPWYRQTAQRLLLERNDKAMVEPLTKLLETTKSPHAKILAAWMLDRLGRLSDEQLEKMMEHKNPRVGEHALRLLEPRFEKPGKRVLDAVAIGGTISGRDDRFCFQLALSIGGNEKSAVPVLAWIAHKRELDRWMRIALQSALPPYANPVFLSWVELSALDQLGAQGNDALMVQEMATLIASFEKYGNIGFTFDLINDRNHPTLRWSGLQGLATGLQRRGVRFENLAEDLPPAGKKLYLKTVTDVFSDAAKVSRDSNAKQSIRLLTVNVLSFAPWNTAKDSLRPIIEKEPSQELRIAALRALAQQQDKEVPALLIKLWAAATPGLRREILEAMLRQPARINVLLDEIEANRLKASELDTLRTRQLANHKDPAIRERAKKLLASNIPADQKKTLAEYQASLTIKGDAKNGREIFKKHCATCHRVAGVGVDVGPDIADTRTKTESAMLFDIIAPNAAIDTNYVNYVVATKDGRVLTGLLTNESASSITLKRAENQVDVVLRKDIDEIASTGISLMPEGLEKTINVREMADLLRFLKDWRYLDGSVPLR